MVYNRIQVAFGALKKITGPTISYQYDVQQILVINGLDLPEYYVVDFCNEGDATVIPMTGTSDGVEIPDSLLQTGKPVKAYIVVSSGQGDIQTRYEVKLPVNTRPMRDDIHPTDHQQQQIDALVDALNSGVSRAETAATEAEASAGEASADADRAEAAATRAEEAVEDVSAYAIRAETAAGHAESSAQDAAESAGIATEKAAEAAGSATASAESAAESRNYAEDAGHSADDAAELARAAGTSASASAASAGQAATSASNAQTSAGQAANSATAAGTSATNAAGSATTATTQAGIATTKAGEAAQSATAASGSATAAANAKNAAETAQGKAEEAQAAAEEAAEEAASAITDKAPVIINTASGDIATFDDGADGMPIRKIVGTIVPVQSGTGDPSPDNVRPISGWDGANIKQRGNLFDQDTVYADFKQQDGSFLGKANAFNGIRPTIPGRLIGKPLTWSIYIKIPSGSTATNPRALAVIGGSQINGNFVSSAEYTRSVVSFTPMSTDDYISVSYGSGASQNIQIKDCQLEISPVVTEYKPCVKITLPIDWQSSAGTIYGGSFTLNEDESVDVVAEMVKRRIDAFTSVIAYPDYGLKFILGSNDIIQAPIGEATPIFSDIYATYPNKPISYTFPGSGICYRQANKQIMISDSRYDNVADFLSAVGNKEIVFMLAAPQTYHFDNVGQLRTFFGTNNVWIDTGSISECNYPADTKLYIDNKIAAAIANVLNA